MAPSELGDVEVEGSRTGRHGGALRAHSDGRGASFLPEEPFAPGERVTVRTEREVRGGRDGEFAFTVARRAVRSGFGTAPEARLTRGRGLVQRFRSRPDLTPPSVAVTTRAPGRSRGLTLLGPKQGRGQDGPMLVDDAGQLVWFRPMTSPVQAADVRLQRFRGAPVLTWWQGRIGFGQGRGTGMVVDERYRPVAEVRAGNGYDADLHEFALTPPTRERSTGTGA